eukprot:TRINITY_DN624_c4_g1_i1.p1 TRINITY_DN624_c4_g1~~TRINITY_DN624_c4_g1_i1.p1  ORF type:complete len:712 (+),score=202.04 TRINITY_DN624_c4_g1_i1:57-2192(+)
MRRTFFVLQHVAKGGLSVDSKIVETVEGILSGSGVNESQFWEGANSLYDSMKGTNDNLLGKRAEIEAKINDYYKGDRSQDYEEFLKSIQYIEKDCGEFAVTSANVASELADTPAPQLVCPVDNARFVLNAGNARWGSLLDALYGSNIITQEAQSAGYCPKRGEAVFQYVYATLDEIFPLNSGSWSALTQITWDATSCSLDLRDPSQLLGFNNSDKTVWLHNNGLRVQVIVDPESKIGSSTPTGIKDVILEAATTIIADAEDSACAVDAEDKQVVYNNWDGLMTKTLSETVTKNGKDFTRKLSGNLEYTPFNGSSPVTVPGTAVLMCRNVGIHMYTDVITKDGKETPEHFLDALITTLSGKKSLNDTNKSIYIVKPKMHGTEEVKFVVSMFDKIEDILGLPRNTVKIGIMDEERRTSINLKQAMHAARERVFFINTGFLDRTGDEIHTAMEMGPVIRKEEIRGTKWIAAYEKSNVMTGLNAKLPGHGQIGKGMWAVPDDMLGMINTKVGHLKAGATTAWVPSPTAATLHALHYHKVSVKDVQEELRKEVFDQREALTSLLTPPMDNDVGSKLSPQDIEAELKNNIQSLLGYVVRWVGMGVGCSKVPDINGVQLMEDRATLRISSQHIANWLHHGIITKEQVHSTLKEMAAVVDEQNASDPSYIAMTGNYEAPEFQAALDLIFNGTQELNGYTEPTLSKYRKVRKALVAAKSA